MSPDEQQEFDAMKQKVQELSNLLESRFGDRPESIGQLIVEARVLGSVSVGGTIRVVTNQGVVDILTA